MVDYGGSQGAYAKAGAMWRSNLNNRNTKLARQAKRRAAGNGPTMPAFFPEGDEGWAKYNAGKTDQSNVLPPTNKYGGMTKEASPYWGAGWGTPNYQRKLHNPDGSEMRVPFEVRPGELNGEARRRMREERVGTNNFIKAPDDSYHNAIFGRDQAANMEAASATAMAFLPGAGLGAGALARTAPTLETLGGRSTAMKVLGNSYFAGETARDIGKAAKEARDSFRRYDKSSKREAAHKKAMDMAAKEEMSKNSKAASFYGNQKFRG